MEEEAVYYNIALSMVKGIGIQYARELIDAFGTSKRIFEASKTNFKGYDDRIKLLGLKVKKFRDFDRVNQELKFIYAKEIQVLFFTDKGYPRRLSNCEDAPMLLYYKGNANLNHSKVVSIVGTRNASPYGLLLTEKLVRDLIAHDVLILSGLAYGIDHHAHKMAYKNDISTVGVLGHSLDRIYPSQHEKLAVKMLENGGLLSEFITGTRPERENFPKRNRIVAGMSDLVIVIESSIKGGSMITAKLANDYNRDVFAFPHTVGSMYGGGCNSLIKSHKAALVESIRDIEYCMNWTSHKKIEHIQKEIFPDLNGKEQVLVNYLKAHKEAHIDEICCDLEQTMSSVSNELLGLEFKGVVKSLPGKKYLLV